MTLNLTSPEFRSDPYPIYSQLRTHEPFAKTKVSRIGESLFVTRYQDAVAVLKDPRFSNEQAKVTGGTNFANAWWIPSVFRAISNSMIMIDDPDHARLRNLVHKGFTPRMIQQMDTRINELSHELLDKAMRKPTVDLIGDFALPLPLTVISEMMGVPPEQRGNFHKHMGKFLDATTGASISNILWQIPNAIGLNRFFRELIDLRKRDPQNDLVTALVQTEEQGDKLSEDELVAMLFVLLLAGHETTVNLIGNGTLALLQHPDQLEKLIANPDLMDSAIEEMLRFTNPVHHISPRYALEDIDLSGHLVRKGGTVLVCVAAANRDESVFKNADVFDIARTPNRHIAFGLGIHYCLGAPLARMEGKIAFNALLSRFPDLKLAVPESQLQWRGGPALRGMRSMPVHLNAQPIAIPA